MDSIRKYATIGIQGFVCGPSDDPFPPNYLSPLTGESTPPIKTASFTSWEITGKIKEKPQDFVVREILPKEDAKFLDLWSHYATSSKKQGNDAAENKNRPLNIAAMPQIPPFELPHTADESCNQSKDDSIGAKGTHEKPRKKAIVGDNIPSPKEVTTVLGSSASNAAAPAELPLEKVLQVYIQNVATSEYPSTTLLKAIDKLNEKAVHRIPTCQSNTTAATESPTPASVGDSEVWIPPLHLQKNSDPNGTENENGGPTSEIEMKAQRKSFHRAIRVLYPFLRTESSVKSSSASKQSNEDENENKDEHWIKITMEDSFDELIKYLNTPRDDLRQLCLFRNWGFEGPPQQPKSNTADIDARKHEPSVVLKLRPGVSKDDRRNVHHILAQKNKHFETSIRNQSSNTKSNSKPLSREGENKPPGTTDLIVTWKKQALRKGSQKNKKRKRSDNDRVSLGCKKEKHLLCVLKKTQKEHLTVMQMLSRSLRCRQGDIGSAGIKDMQAITYQFVTLRNMGLHRAERAIRHQLRSRDVELKILCSNVDFVLNIGDLKGNQFEITVRDLKRVKVDWDTTSNDMGSSQTSPTESFVECDRKHIDQMVERIQAHGFINFYGEQRVGAPGTSNQVGVRAFEIGHAMLQQDFKGAIDLLMQGTRHNETDQARKIRKAWKDSKGDPSVTLKAFGKADIMPRERAVLRGLNRYPDNPLEAIRFLNYNMRIFYINAYQSYVFNRVASHRVKLYGGKVVKGDLYFDKDGDHRDNVKTVSGNEPSPIDMSQVVLPLPGYNVQYPTNEIGEFYREVLKADGVQFEKNSIPEATANGSYRKLIVKPTDLKVETESSCCESMKLSFQLPKGSYATMLLRELMLTTVVR